MMAEGVARNLCSKKFVVERMSGPPRSGSPITKSSPRRRNRRAARPKAPTRRERQSGELRATHVRCDKNSCTTSLVASTR